MEEDAKMQNRDIRRRPAIKPDPGPQTMHALAQADIEKDKATNPAAAMSVAVVGANPNPYPPQPEGSPWAGADPVGDEPPLGYSIDDLPDMEKVER
jgi:hypothetical protein